MPAVAEYGFWALWDWAGRFLSLDLDDVSEFRLVCRRFAYQLIRYGQLGPPGLVELGRIPLEAASARIRPSLSTLARGNGLPITKP
jgi:hypothetical protein